MEVKDQTALSWYIVVTYRRQSQGDGMVRDIDGYLPNQFTRKNVCAYKNMRVPGGSTSTTHFDQVDSASSP